MKKKYLMNGLAALAFGLVAASCSKDVEYSAKDYVSNAEKALGVTIDSNHDWKMTQDVTANITVNNDYGTENTVVVYENDPSIDKSGIVLGKATVTSGNTATFTFATGLSTTLVYAALRDYKGYTYVKPAYILDGKLIVSFGNGNGTTRAINASRRSSTNSYVNIPDGTDPSSYAATLLAAATELNESNNNQNSSGYYWYNSAEDNGIVKNDNYVINYKITGTWNGTVNQLSSVGVIWTGNWGEEWGQKVPEKIYAARTLYVGGTWTIPEGATQGCGNGANVDINGDGETGDVDGVIVVGNGGKIIVNGTLNLANQARLIVLEGGEISGTGTVTVCNGSKAGEESYNYGTISVATLNENFGNFFNYGTITSNTLVGGAGTSCFVNHGTINITTAYGNNGAAANLQIKNNCNFTASDLVSAKIIENGAGAYLKCGSLNMSAGEGGEGLGSYLALDSNSRIYSTGNFSGNNTTVFGPTSTDYAYLCVDGNITQWNMTVYDDSKHIGAIINNLYIYKGGYANDNTKANFELMLNEAIMNQTAIWCGWSTRWGNDHATILTTKDGFNTAPTEGSNCAPSFEPAAPEEIDDKPQVYTFAFEDTFMGDYDMNDVVLQAWEDPDNNTIAHVKLMATGAGKDLYVGYNYYLIFNGNEVHDLLGGTRGKFINTGSGNEKFQTGTPVETTINKRADTSIADLDLWIQAGNNEIHVGSYNPTWQLGSAPFGIAVVGKWEWPTEWTCIKDAYLNFATFAADKTQATDWYTASPVAGTTYYTE